MEEAQKTETAAPEAEAARESAHDETRDSIATAFVDVLAARAAQGLSFAKTALERAATWLHASAERVGELATKLTPS